MTSEVLGLSRAHKRDQTQPEFESKVLAFTPETERDPIIADAVRTTLLTWLEHVDRLKLVHMDGPVSPLDKTILVTKKETVEQLADWTANNDLSRIREWCDARAKSTGNTKVDAINVIVDRLFKRRHSLLEMMSNKKLLVDLDPLSLEAQAALELADQLRICSRSADWHDFDKRAFYTSLLDQCAEWAHFDKNEQDRAQREVEKSILERSLRSACGFALWLSRHLENKKERAVFGRESRKHFVDCCLGHLYESLSADVRELFAEPGRLRTLALYETSESAVALAFDPSSPIWESASRQSLFSENPASSSQCATELLETALMLENQGVSKWNVAQSFLRNEEVVRFVWQHATLLQIQFRALEHYRELREKLISAGASEAALALPSWLEPTEMGSVIGS